MKTGLWIPNEILSKKLSLIAKVIWADIHSLTSEGGEYFKCNGTICKEYGISVATISRALNELHKHNLIETVSFNGRRRALRSKLRMQPTQIEETVESNLEGSLSKIDEAASSKRATESTSKITRKKTIKKRIDGADIALPFDSDNFHVAWSTWLDERKQKKLKNYTPRGEQGQLHNLQKISNGIEADAIAIINHSIVQGYQGLFPLKNERKQKQANKITADGLNNLINEGW